MPGEPFASLESLLRAVAGRRELLVDRLCRTALDALLEDAPADAIAHYTDIRQTILADLCTAAVNKHVCQIATQTWQF